VANAPLRRLSSSVRQVSVVLGAGLQDAGVEDAHRAAIARLNGAVAGTVLYALAPSAPGSGVSFSSELDPADPNCTAGDVTRAATYVNHANDEIVGGRMVFCNVDSARDTLLVLHELGHTYGLNHSVSAHDVMFCQMGRPAAFAAREVLLMGLMRTRRPGNRWPDNDRAAVAPLRGRETVASVCG
jgi:hypothetical protein